MDKNIQESKEFRLAKDLEMAVNSFFFQSETLCSCNSYNAPHAATEPVQTDQGMH